VGLVSEVVLEMEVKEKQEGTMTNYELKISELYVFEKRREAFFA
jgi:hypothetical protein